MAEVACWDVWSGGTPMRPGFTHDLSFVFGNKRSFTHPWCVITRKWIAYGWRLNHIRCNLLPDCRGEAIAFTPQRQFPELGTD